MRFSLLSTGHYFRQGSRPGGRFSTARVLSPLDLNSISTRAQHTESVEGLTKVENSRNNWNRDKVKPTRPPLKTWIHSRAQTTCTFRILSSQRLLSGCISSHSSERNSHTRSLRHTLDRTESERCSATTCSGFHYVDVAASWQSAKRVKFRLSGNWSIDRNLVSLHLCCQ